MTFLQLLSRLFGGGEQAEKPISDDLVEKLSVVLQRSFGVTEYYSVEHVTFAARFVVLTPSELTAALNIFCSPQDLLRDSVERHKRSRRAVQQTARSLTWTGGESDGENNPQIYHNHGGFGGGHHGGFDGGGHH